MVKRHPIFPLVALLLAVALPLAAATIQTPKGSVDIPESTFDGGAWVCASEMAKALGGTFGEDKTYKRPVLQALGHRVLFSEETAIFSLDGKILRLSRPPVLKENCLWVPADFVESLGGKTRAGEADPQPASEPRQQVGITCDSGGTRITLQGKGILDARVKEQGRGVEVALSSGTFGALPLARSPSFDKIELTDGGRGLSVDWAAGSSTEVLRLRNPDRLLILARKAGEDMPPAAPPARDPAPPAANAQAPPPAPLPQVQPAPQNGPGVDLLVLDPGHGGAEAGAEGTDGVLEKDLTLALCKLAQAALERAGFKVLLTRTTDTTLPLQNRTAFANSHQADLFICVHVNSSPSSKARGTETYYHSTEATDLWAKGLADRENADPQAAPGERDGISLVLWDLAQTSYIKMSASLAELLQQQFNDLLSTKDRGVRQAPFAVLQGAQMPAVLLEVAFLSNAGEAKKLADPEFQEQVAQSIAAAAKAFKASSEAPKAASPAPESP